MRAVVSSKAEQDALLDFAQPPAPRYQKDATTRLEACFMRKALVDGPLATSTAAAAAATSIAEP
jgi:hypothetical protein